MVDFSRRVKAQDFTKKTNPIEIYSDLDRKSDAGPLRDVQVDVLNQWFSSRLNDRDVIIKLHTGVGKTLVGLLILQSKLNLTGKPCAYLCPNIFLMEQVKYEAYKFGIPVCSIDADNVIPNEFKNGSKILITTVQKVFNGKSIFGTGNRFTEIGSIVLDDSHACMDAINSAYTIVIQKNKYPELYQAFLSMFEDDLKEQNESKYIDIVNEEYESITPISYWAWDNNTSSIIRLLSENKELDDIKFSWELIKNDIKNCRAFITGTKFEVSPYIPQIDKFGSFHKATCRVLMSATTQSDSFFIKGLGFSSEAVRNPIKQKTFMWSGEKMILIPSLINNDFNRPLIIESISKIPTSDFGIVSIVPSNNQSSLYAQFGFTILSNDNIYAEITKLKKHAFSKVVLCNRYDGIDLPDEACRILIIDSMPYFDSLSDRYEVLCRPNSDVILKKITQKIEQGLGRSVRGEKDYSAIVILGNDLVRFIRDLSTNKFFSVETKKQIEIALETVNIINETSKTLVDESLEQKIKRDFYGLLSQLISRDTGWKRFYEESMNSIVEDLATDSVLEVLELESQAEKMSINQKFVSACECVQNILDNHISDETERGWYLQSLARYKFFVNKVESDEIQLSSFGINKEMLKPKVGIEYKMIRIVDEERLKKFRKNQKKYSTRDDMQIAIQDILDDLFFGKESKKFERALHELGIFLGYECQRPDHQYRTGPDNIWAVTSNDYMVFECKSEVSDTRAEITKDESGQMNNHCAWFFEKYKNSTPIFNLLIPTKNLSAQANFTNPIHIIRKNKLKSLRDNVMSFIRASKNENLSTISDEKLSKLFDGYELDNNSVLTKYSEDYYHVTK